jgi:hypothetical protein
VVWIAIWWKRGRNLSVELNENIDAMAVNDDGLLVAVLTEKIHIPLHVMY